MFDFSVRLLENAHLLGLLTHYAQLGSDDRTVLQGRLMQMEGIDSKELTILHGELIAFNGIEPNAGNVKRVQDGTFSACYRVGCNRVPGAFLIRGWIDATSNRNDT